jgi:hypothetical protein
MNPNNGCTCYQPWMSVLPPPPCPVHSHAAHCCCCHQHAHGGYLYYTGTGTAANHTEMSYAVECAVE